MKNVFVILSIIFQGIVEYPFFGLFPYTLKQHRGDIFDGFIRVPAIWNSQKGQDDITTSAPLFLISSPLRLPSAAASSGMPDLAPPLRNRNRIEGISTRSTTCRVIV